MNLKEIILSKGIKQLISLMMLLFINFLFSYKYLNRITDFALSISLIITVLYIVFFYISEKISEKLFFKLFIPAFIILVLLFIFAFSKISQESLNVDRWSIITEFWNAYFKGNYPYAAKSNAGNYPGPMPFYFILSLPFYFITEIGYFSLSGLILLVFFVSKSDKNKVFILSFLISSLIIVWEILTRSAVLINGAIILIYFFYLEKINFANLKQLVLWGILGGIVFSTRTVFVITFILSFIYFLRIKKINFLQTTIFGFSFVISFILTFLPFCLPFGSQFWEINPFIIQSSFLIPPSYIFLFITLAIIFSFFTHTVHDYFFYNGLVLFLTFFIYIMYHSVKSGFMTAYLESYFDVSYFILAIPFILFSLHTNSLKHQL